MFTAVISQVLVDSFIDPTVYSAVGLDRRRAVQAAHANPCRQQSRIWMAEKGVGFLTDAGMVAGPSRTVWRRAQLVA